ncbi:hypothetical protein BD780_003280 [Clostridium tetanomorphum]|uniref:Zinc ribbon domain-containing protein n=1 Tax=Clostridium tetanomorphum TaxID=1553 RepID=A0A923J3D0_CLOTT|nr:zinc ribbon domain-containing protein [Clostridium tetanomorphum]KAJ53334.1 hypothetical protein CTM_03549 [Clostridium tetanomorphum DSM 665]MBC2400103.1 zinc ribbon domain-containing protein [Clostridium tetanomorphum]MBP1866285.1 putative amidophosphoribosyltransferase [Clostridium tetanomorphum]NRS86055.1 hypothetical protein [Clostridium tetanomorphum]NRZ95924.1 hypothetical protein [Clostridium tetanomorphum]
MFFFGIFGIEERKKSIKFIQNIICKACGSMSTYELIKVYTIFHFFLIPIFKWNKRYFLISRCCNSVFQIPVELGQEIENGKNVNVPEHSLREVYNNSNSGEIVCYNCKSTVDRAFQYCPHCGSKLR